MHVSDLAWRCSFAGDKEGFFPEPGSRRMQAASANPTVTVDAPDKPT